MLWNWLLPLWSKANRGFKALYTLFSVYLDFLIIFSSLLRTNMYIILCNFWKTKFCIFQNWQNRFQKLKWRRTLGQSKSEEIKAFERIIMRYSRMKFFWKVFLYRSNKILSEKMFDCFLPEKGPIILILSIFCAELQHIICHKVSSFPLEKSFVTKYM